MVMDYFKTFSDYLKEDLSLNDSDIEIRIEIKNNPYASDGYPNIVSTYASVDGKDVGRYMFYKYDRKKEEGKGTKDWKYIHPQYNEFLYIGDAYVSPNFRRKGLATKIVEYTSKETQLPIIDVGKNRSGYGDMFWKKMGDRPNVEKKANNYILYPK